MRPRHLLLVMILVIACAGSVVQPSLGASGDRAPALGRHNTITASRMTSVEVRLPRAVTLGLTYRDLGRMFDIDGSGRASGFLLEGHDVDHRDGWPLFGYWNMAFCPTSRCEQRVRRDFPFGTLISSGWVDDEDNPTETRLPAGDYTLHLIAERSPVRVTLRLPGLTGERTFQPSKRERPGVIDPTVTVDGAPGRVVYSFGEEVDLSGTAAFAVTAVRIREDASAVKAVGHCLYQQEPPPEPLAFAPGCPAGTNFVAGGPIVSPFPTDFAVVGYFFYPAADIDGFGTWATTAGAVTGIDGIAFAMELGPRASGGSEGLLDGLVRRTFERAL